MEYMDGGSLADRLADGPLDPATAARVGQEVCAAVRYAHRHGLVHLDLKPANVLFRAAETGPPVAKVGDWGLARFLAEHSGSVEGLSPQYAAPEQFDRDRFGEPDDFTDIYQVGALVYEALTGRPPFEGSGVAVMRAVLDDEPDPPTTVDPALPADADDVLLRALATEKTDRYETVVDLRRALADLGAAGTPEAPAGTASRAPGKADGESPTPDGAATDDPGTADDPATGDDPATADDGKPAERFEGTVDFYDDERETGFVTTPDLVGDVFFYAEDLDVPSVGEGDRLRFGVREAGDERELVDVERIERGTGPVERSTGPAEGERVEGVVHFFNDTAGYGFIESGDVEEDVFFHMEDVGGPDLAEGQEVAFAVEEDERGPRARDLKRL
jgi:cold shock CspA family protein